MSAHRIRPAVQGLRLLLGDLAVHELARTHATSLVVRTVARCGVAGAAAVGLAALHHALAQRARAQLLADAPDIAGGKVQELPTDGTISALNIPHSSIVFDQHQVTEIRAELLGDNGIATEQVKHANLLSFTCLKAFALDQRNERKDAHDLVYCIEHAPGGLDAAAESLRKELPGKHCDVFRASLSILRNRFVSDDKTEGYRKDGAVSVAKFELGEGDDAGLREARLLRQREVSDLIERLLTRIESPQGPG